MNVFEDLVIELKEENLLESTVMDWETANETGSCHLHDTEVPNANYDSPDCDEESLVEKVELVDDLQYQPPQTCESSVADDYGLHETELPDAQPEQPAQGKRQVRSKEFFKKRAMGEVSSLQMVEHVLTGVEREYMKVVPKTFDDFNAKKALHTFLQLDDAVNSEAHATAELALMRETEAWYSALAERDRHVPVYSLRQYCENSRPALSSQALLGLGRFYRNLPYSESVRSKFDFVITRLFSRPIALEKRVCLFTREETVGHINTLYGEWSSVSLYDADDDQSKVMLTALSFEDLSIEAENASTFDQLIESDFFGRLRMFKESISELFFAPLVTAAAIECNIRIGNAYVELIDRERKSLDSESLHSKYGSENDITVSEATGRTLGLVDLLKDLTEAGDKSDDAQDIEGDDDTSSDEDLRHEPPTRTKGRESTNRPSGDTKVSGPLVERIVEIFRLERIKANAKNVNRWFLAGCLLMIAASFGLYVYANYIVDDKAPTSSVANVELEGSVLKEHIKVGKISGDILYAQLLPTWDALSKEKREEYLKKVYLAGAEKRYKQVNLINRDGKVAGYASATRLDVLMP